jgi:L-alanine-DL-glutamate epimerase-like enolase superfamily enzyme
MEDVMDEKSGAVVLADATLKIGKVRTWRAVLRRKTVWKTARYTKGDIDSLVIGISDPDGVTGYGYVPAMFLEGESAPSAEALLYTVLMPVLTGREHAGIQPLMNEVELSLRHNHQLKNAIETALYDMMAKKLNTPLFNLLGGLCFPEFPVMRALTLKPPEETAENALKFQEEGYTHMKLKVGLDPERDVAALKAVRKAVGDDVFLSIDANRSYTPMQAINVISRMEEWGLNLAEQPIRADDVRGMAFIRNHVQTPIMADEGVRTPAEAARLIEAGAVDACSIKLWNVGGFTKGKEIAAVCNANNCFCHIATTPGSQIMEAGQLHFAASTPNMFAGVELAEFAALLDDPGQGLEIVNGTLKVPMGPGTGINIDLSNAKETTPK